MLLLPPIKMGATNVLIESQFEMIRSDSLRGFNFLLGVDAVFFKKSNYF